MPGAGTRDCCGFWNLGDLYGARTQLEEALEIGQATVGPNHPAIATFRRNLDQVLQHLGSQ